MKLQRATSPRRRPREILRRVAGPMPKYGTPTPARAKDRDVAKQSYQEKLDEYIKSKEMTEGFDSRNADRPHRRRQSATR